MITQPFFPKYGSTQTLTPAAGSANVIIDRDKNSRQVRILNTGSAIAYVRIGSGAQTATANDYPIAPNQSTIITKDPLHDQLAHISPIGSTIVVTLGEGF